MSETTSTNENGKRDRSDDDEPDDTTSSEREPKHAKVLVAGPQEASDDTTASTDESKEDHPKRDGSNVKKEDDEDEPAAEDHKIQHTEEAPEIKQEDNNISSGIIMDRTGASVAADSEKKKGPELSPAPQKPAPHRQQPKQQPTAAAMHSTVVPAGDAMVEERGEISVEIAGRVIGKGGEIIRDLQARSGAQIDVDQSTMPGRPRVITYRGQRSKVEFAKKLVAMISSGVSDTNLPIGEANREILIIPSSATGKVIGRGGEMVREMQNRSHAKIDFDHSARDIGPDQKKVVVTGTFAAVAKAKEMILFLVANPNMEAMQSLNLLVDDKLRSGAQWGTGPPYPNLPNQGINMRPEMLDGGGYGAVPGGFDVRAVGGYGGGGFMANPMGGYGGGPSSQGGFGVPPGGGGGTGRFPSAGGPPLGQYQDIVLAKKQFMGRIIGSKGITINDLQRRSGADIQINQDVPPGQDCEIRIKGNRDGVEMAKSMIQQIIEIGPNHPFAGGQGGAAIYGSQAGGYGGGVGYGAQPGYGYGGAASQQFDYPPQQQLAYSQGPYDQQGYQDPQVYGGGGYQQVPSHGGGYPPASGQQAYGGPAQLAPQQTSFSGGYSGYGGTPAPMGVIPPQQQQYVGYQQQPMPPAPAPAVMDTGWKQATTADGQIYYWNERTGATQWEKPPGMP